MHYLVACTITGCRRLLLNHVRQITITPTTAIQLILGRNGSGKSSMLRELTPLPSESVAYIKGGSKTIVYMCDGLKITCTSRMEDKMSHSFDIDGEEKNPGGTEKVQRELVEKYFKITGVIHELQFGEERFSRMSPSKRREWFTRMCDTDYSFAISAFEQLKDQANTLKRAGDLNKKNLVTERAKIMSEAEEKKLELDVGELLAELAILTAERMPLGTSSKHHLDERSRALKSLDDIAMRLLRTRVVVPLEYTDGPIVRDDWGQPKRVSFKSIAEIDSEIDRLKHVVTGHQTTAINLNEQFDQYQKQMDILSKTGPEGVEGLTKQIDELHYKIAVLNRSRRFGLVFEDAKAAMATYESIEVDFIAAVRELPENADRRYGRSKMAELQSKLMGIVDTRNAQATQLQRLEAKREHADHHRGKDKHTCPSCHHSWIVGINEDEYQALVNEIVDTRREFNASEKAFAEVSESVKTMEAYFTQYREVMNFTKSVYLKPFWDHLQINQLLLEAPAEAATMMGSLRSDIEAALAIEDHLAQIENIKQLRLRAAEAGDASMAEVQKRLDEVSDRLGVVTGALSKVQSAVSNYSDYRRQLSACIEMGAEVERYQAMADSCNLEHIEALRREAVLRCIDYVEGSLALKQESLRAVKMQRGIVEALEKQVKHLERQEVAAKTMVKALSPTHGLIAEGLLGFIRNYVGRMNSFINRIWTYPLQIVPTGYDNEEGEQSSELDYKFKVIVERDNNVIPDVSKGSDGMTEIIDLAFKITGLESLGIADAPLILDEIGRPLDEEHRFNLIAEIKTMMESGNYPQLFMISHYVANYSSFTNSEICVLDDRNIVIPAGRQINQHVTIVK